VKLLFFSLFSLLLLFSFPPFNLGFLAWIAFIPFLWGLEKCNIREAISLSFISGMLFYLFHLKWLIKITRLGYFSLSLYLSFYFLLFGYLCKVCRMNYLIPSFWIILEWLRSFLFTGFLWSPLCASQYRYPFFLKILPYTGGWGLSYLLLLSNVSLFTLIKTKKKKHILPLFALFLFLLLPSPEGKETKTLKVQVIQPCIPSFEKWMRKENLLPFYLRLAGMKSKVEMVIFPESILPIPLNEREEIKEEIESWTKERNLSLLLGAFSREDGKEYNSIYFWEKGKLKGVYRKYKLVPFGEYLPFRRIFPFLEKILPPIGDFSPGKKVEIFEIKKIKFAPFICFENIFPYLLRKARSASLIIIATDDSWFGEWALSQHFSHTVIRAAECRKCFLQVGNTGITGWVDEMGRIKKSLRPNKRSTEEWEITLTPLPSPPYLRWGDWFIFFNLAILCSIPFFLRILVI